MVATVGFSVTVSDAFHERMLRTFGLKSSDEKVQRHHGVMEVCDRLFDESRGYVTRFIDNPRFRIMYADKDRIVVLEKGGRVGDVIRKDGWPYCNTCKSGECSHVGFSEALRDYCKNISGVDLPIP